MLKYEEKINVYENTSQITESGIHYYLGISDWNQKLKSYGKTLHNNSSFAYDSEGIYLNDKIEISFSSDENYSVQKKENIKIGNVILTKEKGKEKHFHHQFKITVEDFSFGYINFHSTANDSIHKIEISNECLYVKNGMFILDTLYKIASHFTFKFSNICDYELARDTERNYYANYPIFIYNRTGVKNRYIIITVVNLSTPFLENVKKFINQPIVQIQNMALIKLEIEIVIPN